MASCTGPKLLTQQDVEFYEQLAVATLSVRVLSFFADERLRSGVPCDDKCFIELQSKSVAWVQEDPAGKELVRNWVVYYMTRDGYTTPPSRSYINESGERSSLVGPITGMNYSGMIYLGPIQDNAYGPGIHSDVTGQPFSWQPMTLGPQFYDPLLQVRPNAYGLGIGMDQYGRPVRPACPPGWAGPC